MVWALESASPAFCETPATSDDSIRPNHQIKRKKNVEKKVKPPRNCIVLPWPMYTEPKAKSSRLGTQP